MKDRLSSTLAIIALLSAAFGAYFYIDSRYALAMEFKQLKHQYIYDSKTSQAERLDDRIWTIEERYKGKQMPPTVAEEYRTLKTRKQLLDIELMKLEKETRE